MVGVGGAEAAEFVGWAAVLKAASRLHVGQDDDLVRREDLGDLGHEADAAEGDDVGLGRGRLARQVEAVADEIGEVLDFGRLIIMCQDDGVALALQPLDVGAQIDCGALEGIEGGTHLVLPILTWRRRFRRENAR